MQQVMKRIIKNKVNNVISKKIENEINSVIKQNEKVV